MIRLLAIFALLSVGGCTAVQVGWEEAGSWRDNERVVLEGKLFKLSGEATQICPSSGAASSSNITCVDVVFSDANEVRMVHSGPVVIRGIFRRYSNDFVGMGLLTSQIGIIERAKIVKDES